VQNFITWMSVFLQFGDWNVFIFAGRIESRYKIVLVAFLIIIIGKNGGVLVRSSFLSFITGSYTLIESGEMETNLPTPGGVRNVFPLKVFVCSCGTSDVQVEFKAVN
jgi:hypothetical protein